ncbi:hypothetical protein [Pseudoalteromonas rhizosphaerae]|uniref:hypothetical protein n=1 Tax=Pseudoalteromonas rhizosphaerae TaxID=2518973 RepID=UPI0012310BC9|nr:hypothetical protein [Pseudoalteromonas rhizosphaerae]
MVDKFSKLNSIGNNAALSEQSESDALITKKKLVSNLPVKAEERFNALKKAGKVSGSFNAYIVQATLNNLDSDENK